MRKFVLIGLFIAAGASPAAGQAVIDHHADPVSGVHRVDTDPPSIGQCNQCHVQHNDESGNAFNRELFTENTNQFCYSQSIGGCHEAVPMGYPAQEADRMPEGTDYPGYFEPNDGGSRRVGVVYRTRWPGAAAFESAAQTAAGHYFSPHRNDPNMPKKDDSGLGSCANCHEPHGSTNPFDHLSDTYLNGGGAGSSGPPSNFKLCFDCHSASGPIGMDPASRYTADYYDRTQNPEFAGHQIRRDPRIALSWPASVRTGDMLSCSDCHNAHGSRGADGVSPNGWLISDERPGWSGLTDLLSDTPAAWDQQRRFCFGCHIPSDGTPGSQTVRGIVMNRLPDVAAHRSTSTEGCMKVHDMLDVSSPTGRNVHHPGFPP